MLISEEEKNRIRKLHREYSIIKEDTKPLYEGMDASNIDGENLSDKEEDWLKEDWNDLDENIKEAYRQHDEFKGMEESAIREKYNAAPLGTLCKVGRFLVGWIVKLFRAPLSYMDKQLQGGMGGKHYKRGPAWSCRRRR